MGCTLKCQLNLLTVFFAGEEAEQDVAARIFPARIRGSQLRGVPRSAEELRPQLCRLLRRLLPDPGTLSQTYQGFFQLTAYVRVAGISFSLISTSLGLRGLIFKLDRNVRYRIREILLKRSVRCNLLFCRLLS